MFLLNEVFHSYRHIYKYYMSCFLCISSHCALVHKGFKKKKDIQITQDKFLEKQISERYKINLFN